MELKQKIALSAKINQLTSQARNKDLPLFERMELTKQRIEIFRQLKAATSGLTQEREQIGEHIPNVAIERETANDITITRETKGEPVVVNVKIDREKSQISVNFSIGADRVFDYPETSFTSAVRLANDHITKQLDISEIAINKSADEDEKRVKQKEASKHDWRLQELDGYQEQRERVIKALDAFKEMVKRERDGKEPTPAQREAMREAILDLPTAKAYLDNDGGLFKAGESILPKRLESLNEIIAEIEAEVALEDQPTSQDEPELIKQYKAGELVSLSADKFKQVMAEVHSLGLDLDEIKRGAAAWFEFNEVA